jgi:hypothetical protein
MLMISVTLRPIFGTHSHIPTFPHSHIPTFSTFPHSHIQHIPTFPHSAHSHIQHIPTFSTSPHQHIPTSAHRHITPLAHAYIISPCSSGLLAVVFCSLYFLAAPINPTKSGCGFSTVLFNSGWYCAPIKNG